MISVWSVDIMPSSEADGDELSNCIVESLDSNLMLLDAMSRVRDTSLNPFLVAQKVPVNGVRRAPKSIQTMSAFLARSDFLEDQIYAKLPCHIKMQCLQIYCRTRLHIDWHSLYHGFVANCVGHLL